MNLHIELDRYGRGFVLWVAEDQAGTDATVFGKDPYKVKAIDPLLEERLRKLLESASNEALASNSIGARHLASDITACFIDLSSFFSSIFEDGPSFRIPEPLREALEFRDSTTTMENWIETFPRTE